MTGGKGAMTGGVMTMTALRIITRTETDHVPLESEADDTADSRRRVLARLQRAGYRCKRCGRLLAAGAKCSNHHRSGR